MTHLSLAVLIIILVACAVIALVIGYFAGSRLGGKKSVAMREATQTHENYKSDVREHFEQTSAIMARMVDDYRDMYRHMAEGAEKLAEIHPEKRITTPPAPEAITQDEPTSDSGEAKSADASSAQGAGGSASRGANRDAVMNSTSANDRPWNKESPSKRYGLE